MILFWKERKNEEKKLKFCNLNEKVIRFVSENMVEIDIEYCLNEVISILKSCPHLCWHMHIHKLKEKRCGISIFFVFVCKIQTKVRLYGWKIRSRLHECNLPPKIRSRENCICKCVICEFRFLTFNSNKNYIEIETFFEIRFRLAHFSLYICGI